MVVGTAHCPGLGVKVYVVVAVLLIDGDQLPKIPFVDVVGKAAKASPEQTGATWVNSGVIVVVRSIVAVSVPVLIQLTELPE